MGNITVSIEEFELGCDKIVAKDIQTVRVNFNGHTYLFTTQGGEPVIRRWNDYEKGKDTITEEISEWETKMITGKNGLSVHY